MTDQTTACPADLMPALTFDAFRAANVSRCVKWHPEGIASWSPSDWLTAVTGELGELASLLKMRNRERDGLPGNKFSPTQKQIADELADVLTYLDLLAEVLGVNLGQAAVEKFNEVSERVGFPDRIALSAPPSSTPAAIEEGVRISLLELNELAKVYASGYASQHHITFTVEGLRFLLEHISAPQAVGVHRQQSSGGLEETRDGGSALRDVIAERERQQSVEGWTPEHDDEHDGGQLAAAAAAYASEAADRMGAMMPRAANDIPPHGWPWAEEWWKPSSDLRRDLVKAGALILAEIERLDRAAGVKASHSVDELMELVAQLRTARMVDLPTLMGAIRAYAERLSAPPSSTDFKIRSGLCPNNCGLLMENDYGQECPTCHFSCNTKAEAPRNG